MEFVSLDLQRAEDRYRLEPAKALTPERVFDARWAMALLAEAMDRLSREYVDQGKTNTFETLKDFLDPLNSKKLPPYEQVADQLKVSVAAVKTLIHRCESSTPLWCARRSAARFRTPAMSTQKLTSFAKL